MKKIFKILTCFILSLVLVGCGEEETPIQTEFAMGETMSIKGFDIDFISYSLRKSISENEKYNNLIFLEVNVTNTSKNATKFNNNLYAVYGPDNIRLDKITTSKYDSVVSNLGTIRASGETKGHFVFPYVGPGEYYLEFTNAKKKKLTFKFNVYEEQF